MAWQPTQVVRAMGSADTSTGCTRVVTDVGEAYCKPLGNRQGPCVLASEWLCLRLAQWIGLSTFDAAIIPLDDDATFPLPEHKGNKYHAEVGPCFVTRATPGDKWDGTTERLRLIENPDDVARLVVFDTLVLNRDRHYPDYEVRNPNVDNVYLAETDGPKKYRLVAMDHTHCFGLKGGDEITEKLCTAGSRDRLTYGLFPGFVPVVVPDVAEEACQKLGSVDAVVLDPILKEIPTEWQVQPAQRAALRQMVIDRAKWMCSGFAGQLRGVLPAGKAA